MPRLADMNDRWGLVTGASSGIGAEFARQLAARGMHLILVARRTEMMQGLAAELDRLHGTKTEIISIDLTAADAVQQIADKVAAAGIEVDLLVNCAGFGMVGEILETDFDRVRQMLRLNIEALAALTYQFLPGMIRRNRGAVVNVASIAAFQPVAYMGAYAASKAFVLHFTEALHAELSDTGVVAMAVCPGVTKTDFFDVAGATGWLQKHSSQTPEEVVRQALKALDRGRQYVVTGWRNYLLTCLVRIATRWRVVNESKRFFRPRRSNKSKG